jgi:hypothetical protein
VVEKRLNNVMNGTTRSCGCLRRKTAHTTFFKHGGKGTTEYASWQLMKDRCYNRNNTTYEYYGGRGIEVCDRWRDSFVSFLSDMGKKPEKSFSLDREDGDDNYSPDNCRWASKTAQVRNRRNTKLVKYQGETKPLAEWCEILDLDYNNTNKRLWRGWDVDRAFTEEKRR